VNCGSRSPADRRPEIVLPNGVVCDRCNGGRLSVLDTALADCRTQKWLPVEVSPRTSDSGDVLRRRIGVGLRSLRGGGGGKRVTRMSGLITGSRRRISACALALLAALVLVGLATGAAGGLDPSFGSGGTVLTGFGIFGGSANALAIQTDGKLVAAGYNVSPSGLNYDFALARYNAGGSLDPSFGSGGKVLTNFTDSGSTSSSEVAYAVAVQKDGKILAAGFSDTDNNFGFDFALARYSADGSLDTSFGRGGKVVTDFSGSGVSREVAYAIAIQKDGKIVAAGYSDVSGSHDFALARYNADGSLDTSFGSGGKVLTDFSGGGSFDIARSVVIAQDGGLVVAGDSNARDNYEDFALARYNGNGRLNTSFGSGGKVLTDFSGHGGSDRATGLTMAPDGKLVAVGGSDAGGRAYDFALARYNGNGSLDPSFGSGGKVLTDFSDGAYGSVDAANALATQKDGKIVAAGLSLPIDIGVEGWALSRYNTNGSLDTSFGNGGKVLTEISPSTSFESAHALAIQKDGKIVAAGEGQREFALARYLDS
jgi:uncharacterized delta-60 repeat protein